jgi:hypothetical protein
MIDENSLSPFSVRVFVCGEARLNGGIKTEKLFRCTSIYDKQIILIFEDN